MMVGSGADGAEEVGAEDVGAEDVGAEGDLLLMLARSSAQAQQE